MSVMGTMQFYILAFLFIVLMGFVYFLVRLFLGIVEKLTKEFSELKSFSMGKPIEEVPERPRPIPPTDEDFGEVREETEQPEDEILD